MAMPMPLWREISQSLERRIQAAIHGEPEFHFSSIIGWKGLGTLCCIR